MAENDTLDQTFGLYIHWPFCLSKCPYCDFNSHVADTVDHARWLNALIKELQSLAGQTTNLRLETIFFGGGTPSLMDPGTIETVINRAKSLWTPSESIEITMEANPSTVEISKFKAFRSAGINRLSLGIQSLNDDILKFLGRGHNATEAIQALKIAHNCFDRVSFDLIYATPNQTIFDWMSELDFAIQISGEHLSLYQLTIERGTPFYSMSQQQKFIMPNVEDSGRFYEATIEKMTAAGIPNYEISNHARPGAECRHNLIYWRNHDYLGIGPGAHSRLTDTQGKRWALRMHRKPSTWLHMVEDAGQALAEKVALSQDERLAELLMMGLRLTEGIPYIKLEQALKETSSQILNPQRLEQLIAEKYIANDNVYFRATQAGRQRLNGILQFLLGDIKLY